MENYDPTIEGQWLIVTVVCIVLTRLIEQYRKTITVDGQLDMVCTYLLDVPLVNEAFISHPPYFPIPNILPYMCSSKF